MKRKAKVIDGWVKSLAPSVCNGGIGHIVTLDGTVYFFHNRNVADKKYSRLKIGSRVRLKAIPARSAMGAGPQAAQVWLEEPF